MPCTKKHLPKKMLSKIGRQHKDSMIVFNDNITTVSHQDKKGKPPMIGVSSLHHDDNVEDGNQKKPEMKQTNVIL